MSIEQRKVATLRGDADRKLKKILLCLAAYPEGATPKMIAFDTTINVNTVKALLPKSPLISKKIRGLYIVAKGGDSPISAQPPDLKDWNFHNCILSSETGKERRQVYETTLRFAMFNAKFIISKSGNATLRLETDHPFNVSSLEMAAYLFRSKLAELDMPLPHNRAIQVKTIEFNKDYSNLKMEGVNCVTIDSLTSQFKLYQKRRGLRLEHKTKVPMTVESITDMLTQNPNSVDMHVKMNKLNDKVERLIKAAQTNAELSKALLEKGDRK